MGLIEDIEAKQAETIAVLESVDAKLDEVKAYILTLKSGATEAQLQRILDGLTAMKDKTDSVLAESDSLDDEPKPE